MTTKQTHRAVCSIKTQRTSKPRKYQYTREAGKPWARVYTSDSYLTVSIEQSMVEMTINLDELIDYMGRRALVSSRGISKLQGGMITAKCVGERRVHVLEEREIPLDSGAVAIEEKQA